MDSIKKAKLMFSGELLIFAVIFAVLGSLILSHVWVLGGNFRMIFIFVTIAGCAWFFVDFFWTLLSKKRRTKNSLLDKVLPLPATGTILVTDIISLSYGLDNLDATKELHQMAVGAVFAYFAFMYIVMAVYHYYHPIPMLLEEFEKEAKEQDEEKRKRAEMAAAPVEEDKKDTDEKAE